MVSGEDLKGSARIFDVRVNGARMLVEGLIGWKVRCDYVSENLFWVERWRARELDEERKGN